MIDRCIDRQQNIITLGDENIYQKLTREVETVILSPQMSFLSTGELRNVKFPAFCFHSGYLESVGWSLVSSVGRCTCHPWGCGVLLLCCSLLSVTERVQCNPRTEALKDPLSQIKLALKFVRGVSLPELVSQWAQIAHDKLLI